MADLRDYQPLLFNVYRTLAKQRTSAKYLQIRASGSDRFELVMKAGKIQSMAFETDLSVSRVVGEKKSAWKSAVDVASDFGFLNQWEASFSRLLASAKNSADPRPAFSENPAVEELTHGLVCYDPEIAQMIPAVIYHRMFQLLSAVLEKGYLVDFKTQWSHGASLFGGKPMNFAWVDANGFCFLPQTRIDESVCIYHPERPRTRRFFQASTWKSNQIEDLSLYIEALESTKNAPLLAWSRKNFERIVLLPHVVASLLAELFTALSDGKLDLAAFPGFSDSIEFVDEPENALFALEGIIDATGKSVKRRSILEHGVWAASNLTADKRIVDIYAPVFRGTSPSDVADMSLQGITSQFSDRVLVIEHLELQFLGKKCFVFMPYGGTLYRQGRCLGQVVAPANAFSLSEVLAKSQPIGNPVRMGKFASCGLEVLL